MAENVPLNVIGSKDTAPTWAVIAPQNLNVIRPSAHATCHDYVVEYNGEALWQWRNLKPSYPAIYLNAMNESLRPPRICNMFEGTRIGHPIKDNNLSFQQQN